jgi:glycosyltransferase involved in cell wall biosynthesis
MKILALTTRSPYPLHEGRALRTYNLLKQIARHHEVFLCTFLQSQAEVEGLPRLREFCAEVYGEPLYLGGARGELLYDLARNAFSSIPIHATKYSRRSMMRTVADWLSSRNIDLVHLDMLHLGEYAALAEGLPCVLVEHNVESVILERRLATECNAASRLYLRYQLNKLARYETRLCSVVDEVVTVSDLDAESLRARCPGKRFTTVSNGVDSEFFASQRLEKVPGSLVYVGSLQWFPNLDAIRFFCAEVLPLIAERVPQVTLTVVGQIPGPAIEAEFARYPNVRLTGLVDDVRPIIDRSAAYVVPLRIGGGTRLKILDALSMEQTLVSTSVGCEGLELAHERELLIADQPRDFADAVVRVLGDQALARRLALAGHRRVCSQYDWRSIAGVLENVYRSAVAHHAPLS